MRSATRRESTSRSSIAGDSFAKNLGEIVEAEKFVVGIFFPDDYSWRLKPDGLKVVTLLSPPNIWHPNIRWPFMCLGNLRPGTDLVTLLFQTYEVLTWQKWAA